jgi:PPOX class probable FMN-dependent enzyme
MLEFEEEINEARRLRELMPFDTSVNSALKVSDHINDVARRFIAASPFAVVATKDLGGLIDVSPKGDPGGFVEVYDEKTLIVPDRPGNHRTDTFMNVLTDPNVAILFVVPGHKDTLRVAGKARIVRDGAISKRHAVNGREPLLALVIEVEEAFMHCSKAFVRSRLWAPDKWPAEKTAPTLAEWVISTVDREQTLEELEAKHKNAYAKGLY